MTRRTLALVFGGVILAGAISAPMLAFDPQPDPPAFGLVSVRFGEVLQLHVVCSEHGAGLVGPRACAGALMMHAGDGSVVVERSYRLRPGETLTLDYRLPDGDIRFGDGSVRVGIIPCVIPNPLGGRVIPTVELADVESGRTLQYITPVAPRLSLIHALVPDLR